MVQQVLPRMMMQPRGERKSDLQEIKSTPPTCSILVGQCPDIRDLLITTGRMKLKEKDGGRIMNFLPVEVMMQFAILFRVTMPTRMDLSLASTIKLILQEPI